MGSAAGSRFEPVARKLPYSNTAAGSTAGSDPSFAFPRSSPSCRNCRLAPLKNRRAADCLATEGGARPTPKSRMHLALLARVFHPPCANAAARPHARAYVRHPATPPQSHAASGMPLTSLSPTHVTTFHLLSLSSSAPRHFFPFLPPPLAPPDLTSGHASLPTSSVSRTDAGRLATGRLQSALCTGSPSAL